VVRKALKLQFSQHTEPLQTAHNNCGRNDMKNLSIANKIFTFIAVTLCCLSIVLNASTAKASSHYYRHHNYRSHRHYRHANYVEPNIVPEFFSKNKITRADRHAIAAKDIPSISSFDSLGGISPIMLTNALYSYGFSLQHAKVHTPFLIIVDYYINSDKPRLWIFNLRTHKLVAKLRVAHAANSGRYNATSFSNQPHSKKSCLGIFVTGATYYGKYGYSLRLHGMQPGINDNTYRRSIVIHPGYYMSDEAVKVHGESGHTWGCLALDPRYVSRVINMIKDGSVINSFAG
jgi:hypothetical protein